MTTPTQDAAIQTAAERFIVEAMAAGQSAGLQQGTEAVIILERALCIAWADVAHWRGANDTPARLADTIRTMAQSLGAGIRQQHRLRRGHKPFLKGKY